MSPTFKEIWFEHPTMWKVIAYNRKYKYTRRYFRFRSAVRMAIWIPITAYVFAGLTGWLV